ncbi:uncharacterized protein AB9X84_009365 isoform 3-T7 [Acanthopagrus schlegelii]
MSTNSSSKTNKCCLQSTVLQFSKSESPVTMCGGSCEIWRTLNLERSQRKIQMMAAQKQRITANSITGRHHDGRCQIKYVFHCLDRKEKRVCCGDPHLAFISHINSDPAFEETADFVEPSRKAVFILLGVLEVMFLLRWCF